MRVLKRGLAKADLPALATASPRESAAVWHSAASRIGISGRFSSDCEQNPLLSLVADSNAYAGLQSSLEVLPGADTVSSTHGEHQVRMPAVAGSSPS